MPMKITYCYETEDGEIVDRVFSMGKAPERITLDDGRGATRSFQAEHAGSRPAGGECWPMAPCVASGVNAEQAGELRKHLADRGCRTEVTANGDPIYTSAAHRKRALKIRGFFDKASYN
jgi:hypothetical protein